MKYDCTVKMGGRYFDAGAEVRANKTPNPPEAESVETTETESTAETSKKTAEKAISEMTVAELKAKAAELGIDVSDCKVKADYINALNGTTEGTDKAGE